MDRRSILNCSLVSTHWHGPARVELARLVQDMPFNGFGLVHAIRMRFAEDTFPFLSMTLFDKHVCDLSQLYYHSNPDTKDVFAPAHAPDMLYHLFWTFLFIDQEFRHPKARPKVTCAYFVRLLRNEGGGYPRKYFDKKVLKSIYNDIRSRPLLPAPHVIRALQDVEGPLPNTTRDNIPVEHPTPPASNSGSTRPATTRSRQSSFMSLAGSLRFEESIRRIQQWWRTVRDEGDQNQVGWVSHVDPPVTLTTDAESGTDGPLPEAGDENGAIESTQLSVTSGPPLLSTSLCSSNSTAPLPSTNSLQSSSITTTSLTPSSQTVSKTGTQQRLSNSSTLPHGSLSTLEQSIRRKFGSKSDMTLGHSNHGGQKDNIASQRWAVMNQGYTTVSNGWRAEGDGLDRVVRFPKPTNPSAPADHDQLIHCASVLDMELVI
ncbi:hypothetical protein BGX30_011159 [Mortierella sp. GBA39]|nr:hypothetical protein BGX30_011159 [Mortierella sp. GBA39]